MYQLYSCIHVIMHLQTILPFMKSMKQDFLDIRAVEKYYRYSFFGAFKNCEKRLLISSCLSVCPMEQLGSH